MFKSPYRTVPQTDEARSELVDDLRDAKTEVQSVLIRIFTCYHNFVIDHSIYLNSSIKISSLLHDQECWNSW
jgi:hypothetical protein